MSALGDRRVRLVGRETENAALAAALEALNPRAIVVSGPAGIGKSALIGEVVRAQAEAGALTGSALHVNAEEAMGPFVGALESLVEAGLRSLYDPESGLAGLAQVLGNGGAALAPYGRGPFRRLANQASVKQLNAADAEARFDALVLRVLRWLEGFERPVILVLDDWGRAAPQAMRLYRRICADRALENLRIVAGERPDEQLANIAASRIALPPLSEESLRALVAAQLPGAPSAALAALLVETGASAPLSALERLRRLQSSGLDPTDVVAARALLLAEAGQNPLDQPNLASPSITRLTALLALLETHATISELREGAEADAQEFEAALAALLASGAVVQKDGRIAFAHDSFREAARARLSTSEQRLLASRLAEMLRGASQDPSEPMRGALMLRLRLGGGLESAEPGLWEQAFLKGAGAARRRGERRAAHQFSAAAFALAERRGRVSHAVAAEAALAAIEQGQHQAALKNVAGMAKAAETEIERAEADEMLVYARRMSGDLDGALDAAREAMARVGLAAPRTGLSLTTALAITRALATDPGWAETQPALTQAELAVEAPLMRAVHALGSLLFERSPLLAAGFLASSITPRLAAGTSGGAAAYAVISGNLGLHHRGGRWAAISDKRQSPSQPLRAASMLYATNMGPRLFAQRGALNARRAALIDTALDDGELSVALYAMRDRLQDALLGGANLKEVAAAAEDAFELSERLQDPGIRVAISALRQVIENLIETGARELSGDFFDAEAAYGSPALAPAANTRRIVATLDAYLATAFGDYSRLLTLHQNHSAAFRAVYRNEQSRFFVFATALGLLRAGRQPSRKQLAAIQHAARLNPANHLHRQLLITAEQRLQRRRDASALAHYETAANAAASQSLFELGVICRAGAEAAALVGAAGASEAFGARALEAWRQWGARTLVREGARALQSGAQSAVEARLADATAAQTAAEDANRSRSRFLAAVSHELRTPLQGLKGLVELDDFENVENRAAIRGAVDQLCAVIDELTALAAAESPSPQHIPTALSLHQLMREAAALARPALAEGRRIIVTPVASPDRFLVDAARLRQILNNLTTNAVKYGKGDITLSVTIMAADQNACRACFDVDDQGPALPDAQWARLFEPFARGAQQHSQGLGLGLAISRRLALALGGALSAGATPEGATRFRLDIPLAALDALAATQATQTPAGLKALLAEDDGLSQRVIAAMLKDVGVDVRAAGDGAAAIAAAQAESFDAILLDEHMPGLSGLDAAARIRERTPEARIILISAGLDEVGRARAQAMDVSCLQKPVGRADLASVLMGCAAYAGAAKAFTEAARPPAGAEARAVTHAEVYDGAFELIAAIDAAIAGRDLNSAARLIHKLRGMAAQFGLGSLAHLAAEIEDGGRDLRASDMARLRQALNDEAGVEAVAEYSGQPS
jgi:signal transduction histidine kinase/ActR/RegA family two-component response regulator